MNRFVFLSAFLFVIFCTHSCTNKGDSIYFTNHKTERNHIRKRARKDLPDSLISFFPSVRRITGVEFLGSDQNLYFRLPGLKDSRLLNQPLLYAELYHIEDSSVYYRNIDIIKSKYQMNLADFKCIYTFEDLWRATLNIEEDVHSFILVPEVAIIDSTAHTVIVAFGTENLVGSRDESAGPYKNLPEKYKHGYSSGVTYSREKRGIYYWTVLW